MKKIFVYVFSALAVLSFNGCGKDASDYLFSLNDDLALGMQVKNQIESDTSGYIILDTAQYSQAYFYINRLTNRILQSEDVKHKDEFVWRVRIIQDDNTLNAFAAPGGYIYFYTGLIKYLDSEDALAGVMGHEIAHAAERHTMDQLVKTYGTQYVLSSLLGENAGQLSQIAAGLALQGSTLKFSRDAEREADRFSVLYLDDTQYACDGASFFFAKLLAEGQVGGGAPSFLSTHPDPEERVENVTSLAQTNGCSRDLADAGYADYADFKASLP